MLSINKVFLVGNLTRDPELRYTPGGQAVTRVGFAVSHNFKSQSGEFRKETSFVDVVVWGRQAETCSEYLKKGSQAFVEGRLRVRDYDARDGSRRRAVEVVASRVQFMDRAPRRDQAEPSAEKAPAAEAPAAEVPAQETVDEPMPSFEEEEQ